MKGLPVLEVVKTFIDDTAPEGEILKVARQARLRLEHRTDTELFTILSFYFQSDATVLGPSLNYDQLLGTELRASVTRNLFKARTLWEDGHWDEFLTKINGVMEAVVKQIYRTKYASMGLDQQRGEKQACNPSYAPLLATNDFKTTFPKLQAHATTIQGFSARIIHRPCDEQRWISKVGSDAIRCRLRPW